MRDDQVAKAGHRADRAIAVENLDARAARSASNRTAPQWQPPLRPSSIPDLRPSPASRDNGRRARSAAGRSARRSGSAPPPPIPAPRSWRKRHRHRHRAEPPAADAPFPAPFTFSAARTRSVVAPNRSISRPPFSYRLLEKRRPEKSRVQVSRPSRSAKPTWSRCSPSSGKPISRSDKASRDVAAAGHLRPAMRAIVAKYVVNRRTRLGQDGEALAHHPRDKAAAGCSISTSLLDDREAAKLGSKSSSSSSRPASRAPGRDGAGGELAEQQRDGEGRDLGPVVRSAIRVQRRSSRLPARVAEQADLHRRAVRAGAIGSSAAPSTAGRRSDPDAEPAPAHRPAQQPQAEIVQGAVGPGEEATAGRPGSRSGRSARSGTSASPASRPRSGVAPLDLEIVAVEPLRAMDPGPAPRRGGSDRPAKIGEDATGDRSARRAPARRAQRHLDGAVTRPRPRQGARPPRPKAPGRSRRPQ